MRKIERQMLQAIVDDKDWSKDNTRVESRDGVKWIYLHGHCIAAYYPHYNKDTPSALHVNNCGYTTNTTKSRLNALIDFHCDVTRTGIFQKNWNWFLNRDGAVEDFPSNEWVAV